MATEHDERPSDEKRSRGWLAWGCAGLLLVALAAGYLVNQSLHKMFEFPGEAPPFPNETKQKVTLTSSLLPGASRSRPAGTRLEGISGSGRSKATERVESSC